MYGAAALVFLSECMVLHATLAFLAECRVLQPLIAFLSEYIYIFYCSKHHSVCTEYVIVYMLWAGGL